MREFFLVVRSEVSEMGLKKLIPGVFPCFSWHTVQIAGAVCMLCKALLGHFLSKVSSWEVSFLFEFLPVTVAKKQTTAGC